MGSEMCIRDRCWVCLAVFVGEKVETVKNYDVGQIIAAGITTGAVIGGISGAVVAVTALPVTTVGVTIGVVGVAADTVFGGMLGYLGAAGYLFVSEQLN